MDKIFIKYYRWIYKLLHPPVEYHPRWKLVLKMVKDSKKVVDLGCGNVPVEGATVAVDINIDPKERALGNGSYIDVNQIEKKGVCFVKSRIDGQLPFRDKEFDFAYSHHVFEHLENPETACKEVMRIAKAGAIITPSPWAEISFGRPYHRWIIFDRGGKLFFLKKRKEEDRPFGDHPEFSKAFGYYSTSKTNPFDIILNDGGWYKFPFIFPFIYNLRKKIKTYWDCKSPIVDTIFIWKDRFDFEVIEE